VRPRPVRRRVSATGERAPVRDHPTRRLRLAHIQAMTLVRTSD
jgi:hypothetical protein